MAYCDEWPEEVRRRTLKYIRNNNDGKLISINVLEYATVIINYVASTFYFTKTNPDPADPYPVVLIEADNTTSESWVIKACKVSFIGRAQGRLQCALMINNPVGINAGRISTEDNFIADGISRIANSSNADDYFLTLQQDYPQLRSCRRFHPSAELVSAVVHTLLHGHCTDPLQISRTLLNNLGKNTICDGVPTWD